MSNHSIVMRKETFALENFCIMNYAGVKQLALDHLMDSLINIFYKSSNTLALYFQLIMAEFLLFQDQLTFQASYSS